jgi:creatinine amidohydrolase
MGSTEQHGPHLPLGSDYLEAFDLAKQISARTGVLVAPTLLVGYSAYHTGFPGTLSIRPETMEQVLFEVSESLIKYGFRRIMFFNYHGGNNIIQDNVIHKINHETEAIAISIGWGSTIQNLAVEDSLDYHAGVYETSTMLFLEPSMVRIEKFKKPIMHFTPEMEELMQLSKNNPQLNNILDLLLGVPSETKKGGASNELSDNGIWSLKNPKIASVDIGKKLTQDAVERAVKFIESWKKIQIK